MCRTRADRSVVARRVAVDADDPRPEMVGDLRRRAPDTAARTDNGKRLRQL